MNYEETIEFIKASHNQANVEGMARYSIKKPSNSRSRSRSSTPKPPDG